MRLKEVLEKGILVKQTILLYGATAEFQAENGRLFRAIGEAICREKGVFPGQAMSLPADTILGAGAEDRFEEWQEFLRASHPVFA